MRIALVGVLPPLRSGIADHTLELARALAERNEVTLYVEDPMGVAIEPACPPIRAAADLPGRRREHDVVLYQAGNHAAHGFVIDLVRRVPGVVDLHDATLHDLTLARLVGARAALARELARNEGALAVLPRLLGSDDETRSAVRGWVGRPRYRLALHSRRRELFPLRRAILGAARAVIVHSPHLAALVRASTPGVPVVHVPHGVRVDLAPLERTAARRAVGLTARGVGPTTLVCMSFGLIQPHKRIGVALDAVQTLRAQGRDVRYVLVGPRGPDLDVELAIRSRRLESAVEVVDGFPPVEDVARWMQAADVGIALRGPSTGGISGAWLKMMALGLPTIATAVPEGSHLPPDATWFVPTGGRELPELVRALEQLADDPVERAALGERGRVAIERHGFAWPAAARAYEAALGELTT
ncbi:MAG: glycosyltransferase family 4 protein [Deltaproteobacteria bacterium]|nr:glycosyltransferase family 4 protein [Deltaproteobacteria bacterium]